MGGLREIGSTERLKKFKSTNLLSQNQQSAGNQQKSQSTNDEYCKKCNGLSGYWENNVFYAIFCPCEIRNFKVLAVGEMFCDVVLEKIKPKTPRQDKIKSILLKKPMGSYYFYGELSSGKSHFLASLYNYAIDHNYYDEVCFVTDRWLKRDLVDLEMDRLGERTPTFTIERISEGRIRQLFLDDLGKTKISEFVRQEIFSFIDEMWRKKLRFVVSSNFTLEELSHTELLGAPICRRIEDMCQLIRF